LSALVFGELGAPGWIGPTRLQVMTATYFPKAACTFPTPDTCELDLGFTSSSDDGLTWRHPHRLNKHPMDLAWLANTQIGHMVGDYLATAFAAGHTVSVCALASAPVGGLLQEAMFAAVS
jgi:hypothetical protein